MAASAALARLGIRTGPDSPPSTCTPSVTAMHMAGARTGYTGFVLALSSRSLACAQGPVCCPVYMSQLGHCALIWSTLDGQREAESLHVAEVTGTCVEHAGLDSLRVRIAYGILDTRGRIDSFSLDSPLKLIRVAQFPADFFFVLRVVQVPLVICGGLPTLWHKVILGSGRVPG